MSTSIMQKNYSHQPLKKRPVFIVKEGNYQKRIKLEPIDFLQENANFS